MRIQAFALMVGILAACSSSEAGRPGGDVGSGGDATGASPDAGADARTDATDATGATEVGLGSDVVGVAGEDEDFDGIDDGVDNCPGLFNPKQEDIDQDDLGDACDATIDDCDRAQRPRCGRPVPRRRAAPGVVNAATVYAHTASELYFLEVKTGDVFLVDDFHWPADASSREMTDIAIDRFGVLYGISFSDVFVIHPQTAQCWRLAALPQQFNGLTHISRTLSGTANDALVGISNDGGWWRLALVPTVPPSSQQRVELRRLRQRLDLERRRLLRSRASAPSPRSTRAPTTRTSWCASSRRLAPSPGRLAPSATSTRSTAWPVGRTRPSPSTPAARSWSSTSPWPDLVAQGHGPRLVGRGRAHHPGRVSAAPNRSAARPAVAVSQ